MTYTAKTNWTAVDGVSAADLNRIEQGISDITTSALPATSYTAADVLAKLVTVDGSGSNLDADKVRGKDAVLSDGTQSMTGNLAIVHANAGVEMGSVSVVNTPFIDFHSSGNNIDYDARIIASGGNSSPSNGTLNLIANGGVQINGTTLAATRNNAGTIEWWDGSTWRAVGGVKNVQRGVASGPNDGTTTFFNITISTVNLSKSFLSYSVRNPSGLQAVGVTVRLTSSTNIQVESGSGGGNGSTVSYEVIESY